MDADIKGLFENWSLHDVKNFLLENDTNRWCLNFYLIYFFQNTKSYTVLPSFSHIFFVYCTALPTNLMSTFIYISISLSRIKTLKTNLGKATIIEGSQTTAIFKQMTEKTSIRMPFGELAICMGSVYS